MTRHGRHLALATALIACAVLMGCDRDKPNGNAGGAAGTGTSGSGGGSTATFSVGGSISGLTASGLVLGTSTNQVAVAAGAASFSLPNLFAAGASYAVGVVSQAQGQTCSVAGGSGKITSASITNVQVTCSINSYSVGGTVTGLSASGLVLANGTDTLAVSTGAGAFVFPTKVASQATYAVSIQVQPLGLSCQVIDGTGTVTSGPVSTVMVACGQWEWTGGADTTGAPSVYGTAGVAAPGNVPGARSAAVSGIDSAGNLWLFGGNGASGELNDLWRYSPGTGEWAWVSGSQTSNAMGVYGTQNLAASGNVPGARMNASSWIDASGNLWIFGGQGYDSAGTLGSLNDLWEYDLSKSQWIWVSGALTAWPAGATPPLNEPGGRSGAVSWIDATGNLWLFGGTSPSGLTSDLWEFIPGSGLWTLMSGSQTPAVLGIYGKQGTGAAGNAPGSRAQGVSWLDTSGNLWLFGGTGYGSIGSTGALNDLWEYNIGTGWWTWISGSSSVNTAGIYAAQTGPSAALATPGARSGATGAADAAGNLWLFGGNGYDSARTEGLLNDLWVYSTSTSQWIWMGGSPRTGAVGVYGTQGVAAASDTPGERSLAVSWIDGSGNFWLLGGQGWAATKTTGLLNDLWEFEP